MSEIIGSLIVELGMDAGGFTTGSTKAQKDLASLRDKFQAFGDSWNRTAKRLTIGVSAPLAAFGVLSAKAASDADELQSAFNETFGAMSGDMTEWARITGDAMGRSTQSMQEMANTFGIFFNQAAPTRKEAAEMSKTFSVLAQDLSSFYNVSGDVALQKLRSGLTGEAEPLRDFGVFLTAATVEAKALEMGLASVGGEISEQSKIMARYQIILDSTANAQGDVARTADGTANQARSFTEALEELRVVIGQKLLPIITPMIEGLTNLVNRFNGLPSGVQTAVVAFGAFAAALGPIMLVMGTLAATVAPLFLAKFGAIGLAISAIINPLGTAAIVLAKFVAGFASLAALKGLAALLLRFAGPLGLIVTAGTLIYQNWDRIAAVFQQFAAAAREAIGPPMQKLVATISDAFNAFWSGPMGDGLRTVIDAVTAFGKIVLDAMGDQLVNTLKALLEIAVGVFRQIGNGIELLNAILTGDWATAWKSAKQIVVIAAETIWNAFKALAPNVVASMQRLYSGVKMWLQDKLGAVFSWVTDKVAKVESAFAWLYNEVVGNSWIPDMVREVGEHMAKLDRLMVDPTTKATQSTERAFAALAGRVQGIMDRIFPQFARIRQMNEEIADIDAAEKAGQISGKLADRLRFGVKADARGATGDVPLSFEQGPLYTAKQIEEASERVAKSAGILVEKTKIQTVQVAKSFKDMASDTISALDGLAQSIKGGGFLDIFGSVLDLVLQLGSTGLFGQTIAANINKPSIPGYANGTSFHPGGLALVGERGPELLNMPRGSQVMTNSELRGFNDNGGSRVEVIPSPYFDVRVDGRIVSASPSIMEGGAQVASSRMSRKQSRRVG